MKPLPTSPITGCVEGWYGRLLDWPERQGLMQAAARAGMNSWWYAPKEDPAHRFDWRYPYERSWRASFSAFCRASREGGMRVIAGMAPGIDFDFSGLPVGDDMQRLVAKTQGLLDDGADVAALLLDDIDPDFMRRAGSFSSEGEAHAALANELSERLGCALLVVPRIYANELHADAPDYLPRFAERLDDAHAIVLCGSDVVAREVTETDCRHHLGGSVHRIIVWDNLYANDYCPRRLFVGPWRGRLDLQEFVLNPTGMPATDALLFDIVAAGRAASPLDSLSRWRSVLDHHGVPAAFDAVADCFDAPVFNTPAAVESSEDSSSDSSTSTRSSPSAQSFPASSKPASVNLRLEALDELTWRWKSALAREWFPYLMSLRHDLLLESHALPLDRINKTQTPPLARHLSGSLRTSDN